MDGQALIAQLAKQTDKLLFSKSASLWYASERFDCGLYSVTTVLSALCDTMLKYGTVRPLSVQMLISLSYPKRFAKRLDAEIMR